MKGLLCKATAVSRRSGSATQKFGIKQLGKSHFTNGRTILSAHILGQQFKADRLQVVVGAKKYICVATVHQ